MQGTRLWNRWLPTVMQRNVGGWVEPNLPHPMQRNVGVPLPWQASKEHWVELRLPHQMQKNVGVEVESVQRMSGRCRKKKTTGRC